MTLNPINCSVVWWQPQLKWVFAPQFPPITAHFWPHTPLLPPAVPAQLFRELSCKLKQWTESEFYVPVRCCPPELFNLVTAQTHLLSPQSPAVCFHHLSVGYCKWSHTGNWARELICLKTNPSKQTESIGHGTEIEYCIALLDGKIDFFPNWSCDVLRNWISCHELGVRVKNTLRLLSIVSKVLCCETACSTSYGSSKITLRKSVNTLNKTPCALWTSEDGYLQRK